MFLLSGTKLHNEWTKNEVFRVKTKQVFSVYLSLSHRSFSSVWNLQKKKDIKLFVLCDKIVEIVEIVEIASHYSSLAIRRPEHLWCKRI